MQKLIWVPWCHILLCNLRTTLDISVRLCHAFAIRDPISTNNTYETVHSVYQGYLIIRGNMSQFSRALFFLCCFFRNLLSRIVPFLLTTCNKHVEDHSSSRVCLIKLDFPYGALLVVSFAAAVLFLRWVLRSGPLPLPPPSTGKGVSTRCFILFIFF